MIFGGIPDEDQNGDGSFGMGGFQMMGIMNALKTGDVQTDMIIAMIIPFVIKFLFGAITNMGDNFQLQSLFDWLWPKESDQHERFITYRSTRSSWGSTSNFDEDTQNSVLLKAIKLYINQVLDIKLRVAYLDLTGTEDKKSSSSFYSPWDCYDSDDEDDDDDDDEGGRGSRKTLAGMLSRYKVIKTIPNDEWHELGVFGDPGGEVEMRIESSTSRDDQGKKGNDNNNNSSATEVHTVTFHFISDDESAIDAFIDKAYKWYLAELRKGEDNSRYYYDLKPKPVALSLASSSDDGNGNEGACSYKRYKLSDEKTFDSLFFSQKESLLAVVNHFTKRSGKYAIKGYPHKLGLLLHGPPGSGKTSLIKALAHKTGRSIVNVPLARVSTNSELMSIFFDQKYRVEGGDVSVRLGFKDVIFVLEDVDAASRVVKRRDGKKASDLVQGEPIDLPMPKSMWRMLLESSDSNCRELVETLLEKSDRLRAEANKPEVLRSIAQRMMVLPGLGLVGESDDHAVARIGNDAVGRASDLMGQYSTVDGFLGSHAQIIKSLIESGTEVDDDFVDYLLGTAADFSSMPRLPLSRDTSLARNGMNGNDKSAGGGGHDKEEFMMESVAQLLGSSDAATTAAGGGGGDKSISDAIGPSLPWRKEKPDQLSLAGLLNVLDGVVDTPNRIVIMTTNHPEMLDPALIRPGRIDKKILLGTMLAGDIIEMLQHYFQTELSEEQSQRIRTVIDGDSRQNRPPLGLTPAQVEQLAVEHDVLEDMISAIEGMGRSAAPKARFVSA